MSHIFRAATMPHHQQQSWEDRWWQLIRSCCLQDDDYWWLVDRFKEDEHFRRIFYRTWVTPWFHRTVKARSRRGSVNTLWYGQQRGSKSYSLLDTILRLDPTFHIDLRNRITFHLRTLEARLKHAQPGQFFMHDEARKSGQYGEGSKWMVDKISDFLETHAKTGVSIGFATPVKKFEGMLAGINFSVEIIGYNKKARVSMGILRSHRNVELGFVFFRHPPQPIVNIYEEEKDAFLAGRDEETDYDEYIQAMQTHSLWDEASAVSDFDMILWDQEPSMPTGLRGKIARKAWLQQRTQGRSQNGQPRNVIVVHDDFLGVLKQCARQILRPLVNKPVVVERWILRYFHGLKWPKIAEELRDNRADTTRKSITDKEEGLDARITKDMKAKMLENAVCIFLNAKLFPTASTSSSSQDLSWRLGGGPGSCDVYLGDPQAPRVAVNCKLKFGDRPSWEVTPVPESERAPPGHCFVVLVTLSPTHGAHGPHVYRIPENTQVTMTSSCEEIEWEDWLNELREVANHTDR